MQRRGIADRSEPETTHLAVLLQPLECRHHLTEHLRRAERFAAAVFADRIVQMQNVDPIEPHAREAGFKRYRHGIADAAELRAAQPHLGADEHAGGFEALQHAAEILFRLAVAVQYRGVEIVHARGDRAGDGALLIALIAADHQSADRTAAETQSREPHAAAAEVPHLHRRFSRLRDH